MWLVCTDVRGSGRGGGLDAGADAAGAGAAAGDRGEVLHAEGAEGLHRAVAHADELVLLGDADVPEGLEPLGDDRLEHQVEVRDVVERELALLVARRVGVEDAPAHVVALGEVEVAVALAEAHHEGHLAEVVHEGALGVRQAEVEAAHGLLVADADRRAVGRAVEHRGHVVADGVAGRGDDDRPRGAARGLDGGLDGGLGHGLLAGLGGGLGGGLDGLGGLGSGLGRCLGTHDGTSYWLETPLLGTTIPRGSWHPWLVSLT